MARMSMHGSSKAVLGACSACVVLILATSHHLPDPVVAKFAHDGSAGATMGRSGYVLFMLGLSTLLPLGVVFGLGHLLRRLPHLINIPHRQQWLSEPHRQRTLASLTTMLAAYACLHVTCMMSAHLAILHAHTSDPPRLSMPALYVAVGGFVLGLVLVTGVSLWRFRRPPAPR